MAVEEESRAPNPYCGLGGVGVLVKQILVAVEEGGITSDFFR